MLPNFLRMLDWHQSTLPRIDPDNNTCGTVALYQNNSALKILTSKPMEKRPLGRPSRRWEDTIRINLKEIGFNTGKWIDLTQDMDYWRALVIVALNLRVL